MNDVLNEVSNLTGPPAWHIDREIMRPQRFNYGCLKIHKDYMLHWACHISFSERDASRSRNTSFG